MWPQQWGRFFCLDLGEYVGTAALGCPTGRSPHWSAQAWLENSPHKVRQQREQQQHKHPANPDQEVRRQLRRVDFFLVHASR